ncbi:hypothetical protein [[Eubacterium] cellulosolvens]
MPKTKKKPRKRTTSKKSKSKSRPKKKKTRSKRKPKLHTKVKRTIRRGTRTTKRKVGKGLVRIGRSISR